MSLSALVIGCGSIGSRHAKIMSEMDEIGHLSVLSSRSDLPYEILSDLEDVPVMDPDYVVIASSTDQHHTHLAFLEKHLKGKKILVEKPLFDFMEDLKVQNNEVVVGYNLRFHPLLNKIRDLCEGRHLWNIFAFCGSYLPDWRPDQDYRVTSSASRQSGGVLRDLSHELDYVQWLAGSLQVTHAVSRKVSNLEISSDDLLLFSGQTQGGACVQIGLNYFTREPIRKIILDGEDISIQGDLIENQLSATVNGKKTDFIWPDFERNDTYRAMHHAVLEGDLSNVCNYDQGLQTMALIERIRSWSQM